MAANDKEEAMKRGNSPVACGSPKRGLYLRGAAALAGGILLSGAVDVALQAGPSRAGDDNTAPSIQWRSGAVKVVSKDSWQIRDALEALTERGSERHLVVQFEAPVDAKLRARLQSAGLRLLSYLGSNAFFASIRETGADPAAISLTALLIDVRRIRREWRLHPYLLAGNVPSWAVVSPTERYGKAERPVVGAYVLFHPDVPLAPTGVGTVLRHGAVVRDELESINGLVIELPFDNIPLLADEDVVQWIEPPLPRMSAVNDSSRAITGAAIVQAPPYGLDGSGVTVLVYDGGTALASHADFGGRLTVRDSSGLHSHPTHVACTVGGSGAASGGQYRGMAPAVTIESYGYEYDGSGIFLYTNPGDIEDDYDEAINVYEADISNNSIGTNTCWNFFPCNITGDYGVTSVLIDSIVTGSLGDPFRIVWANGNERDCPNCPTEHQNGYHSTAPPSCAKNHLTVGALNSNDDSQTTFTSWGPCDDGRLKPDVSAPGCQSSDDFGVTSCTAGGGYDSMCGTSMASPTVCGLGALLLQDFRAHYPGELDFRNSTLRVVLAQTAQDRGNPGPDYSFGYGSARIQPAVDLMRSGNFLEAEVDQGGIYSVLVVVEPGDPELKVTLAWDDAPGTPNVDPALVNDLDLVVYDPSSAQHFPWLLDPDNPSDPAVRTQADHVNNIEQVFVDSPASGAWRVEIHGFNVPVGAQAFSLCATPLLIQCSTQGVISLDRVKYQCESVANIQVVDCDLNTDDGLIETVQVTIESDTEPAGETVLLTETGPETAAFRGTIALSTTDAAGVLQVTEGDTVTATYIDEDDGFGGTDIVVEATAVVDCQGPVISNVQAVDIGPLDATITFETDEPAQGVVRYGLSCGSLIEEAMASGYQTSHSVHLVGLEDDTTYFYAVDAEDEAGNTASDDNGGNCYTFSTPEVPDYFTEEFLGDFDLGNKTVTFQPDGSVSFYRACTEDASAFPTDPAGGTVLSLGDDDFSTLTLSGGQTVSLYGASYDTFYVGSNGYITFVAGDQEYWETLAWHFGLPRISGLFRDLNPSGSPWCPGEGDCCVANLTPGCEDVGCCETVCAMDDYCCVFEWDEFCADMAIGACPICSPFPPRETRQDIPRNGTAPGADPTVSWKELGDRVAVTYENVPEFGTSNSNSFQIEMFFDDVIRITWLSLGATYGISGLSAGDGLPSVFAESDLSAYGICDCLAVTPGEGLSSSGYEGGPFTPECATYTLTNNCDTSVNWTAAGTQTWVDVDPAGGTLAASGSAPVDVCINANANGLPPDTHNDTVTITNTTSGVAQTRHVTLEVFDGLVVTPTDDFASEGEEGGPFEPECATYTLTNSGSASLEWAATGTQAWLDVDPSGGTLAVSAFTTVDVCINTNANSLTWDVYTDTVTFTNETSGMTQTRGVELTVWEPCLPPPAAGSPDPADEAAGVPVDTDLEWNGQGVEVSVRLRGGATGTSSVSLAYLPEGWVTPKRAASTSLVGPGYRAARSSMAVLLLASGADPTILRTALAAFPDVDAVDYFDASMAPPSVGTLTAYDVVVAMSDSPFADSIATGNALADYVDVGGKVVQAVATFATGGGWELGGRFVTDGVYEPFAHGGPEFYPHSLGTFDTGHPIMAGVTALTDGLPAGVAVRPGAQWVADWNNGTPLVATQGTSVVGINIYAFDSGDYTGDVALLFHNALVWLVEDDDHCATTYDVYFGTDNPPATMICADIGRKVCDPGVLDFLTTYYWQVVARTPAGETSGPVWSFTTVCPPADQPTQPAGEEGYEKIRCISMVPGNPGQQTALRVTLTNLPAPFSGFNGTEMWVGEPREVSENAGKVNHEPGWPDFMSANLQCTPYCMDWSTAGVLHVTDDDIIPSAVYDVQAIGCECDFDDEADYSTPLTITTSTWGDLVRNCTTCPCGAPDGTVGVPTDVTAALDKFKNLRPPSIPCDAVIKSRADVEPNFPDWLVNITDVTQVLDAFRGCTYSNVPRFPFCAVWAGPGGCP